MKHFPVHIYFEAAALITCIFCWKGIKHTPLKWFLPFLLFIVAVEITGWYLPVYLKMKNAVMYNFAIPAEYLFLGGVFFGFLAGTLRKKILLALLAGYLMYVVVFSLAGNITLFNYYYLIAGNALMVLTPVFYFIEQYQKQDDSNIGEDPLIWVAIGVFLFNMGELTYNFSGMFIFKNQLDPSLRIFRDINNNLIKLYYLLIAVAFICQMIFKKYRKPLPGM